MAVDTGHLRQQRCSWHLRSGRELEGEGRFVPCPFQNPNEKFLEDNVYCWFSGGVGVEENWGRKFWGSASEGSFIFLIGTSDLEKISNSMSNTTYKWMNTSPVQMIWEDTVEKIVYNRYRCWDWDLSNSKS